MQDDSNWNFISNTNAITYVKDMQKSLKQEQVTSTRNKHAQKLAMIGMSLTDQTRELGVILDNLLQFNPFYRMTAFEQASTFSIFDCVRNSKLE